jgi:hypothetical protein
LWAFFCPLSFRTQGGFAEAKAKRGEGRFSDGGVNVCRNIKTLYNFEPAASDGEIRAAALQFVRKISGFTKPSEANQEAFDTAVDRIAETASTLLGSLVTKAPPRNREVESHRARARAVRRSGG